MEEGGFLYSKPQTRQAYKRSSKTARQRCCVRDAKAEAGRASEPVPPSPMRTIGRERWGEDLGPSMRGEEDISKEGENWEWDKR